MPEATKMNRDLRLNPAERNSAQLSHIQTNARKTIPIVLAIFMNSGSVQKIMKYAKLMFFQQLPNHNHSK